MVWAGAVAAVGTVLAAVRSVVEEFPGVRVVLFLRCDRVFTV
jgi:hypothetical protein